MRRSLPAVCLAAAAIAAACNSASTTTAKQGTAVVHARATSLAVNDTMTLTAGVKYTNGSFVPFTVPYGIVSRNPLIATIDTTTRLMRGVGVGDVVLRVTISNGLTFDTTFTVTP
jgi:hypothetical protein